MLIDDLRQEEESTCGHSSMDTLPRESTYLVYFTYVHEHVIRTSHPHQLTDSG